MENLLRVFQNKKEKKKNIKRLSFIITQFKIEFLLPPTGSRKVLEKNAWLYIYILYIYMYICIYIYTYMQYIYIYIYIYHNEFYQDQTYIDILIKKCNLTSLIFSCSLYVLSVASSFDSNPFNMRILFRFRNETERPYALNYH